MHTKTKRNIDRKYTRKNRCRRPLRRSAACLILALAVMLAAAGCMKREKVEGVRPVGEAGVTSGGDQSGGALPPESGAEGSVSGETAPSEATKPQPKPSKQIVYGEIPSVQVVGDDFFGRDRSYRLAKSPPIYDRLVDITAYYAPEKSSLTLSGTLNAFVEDSTVYNSGTISFTGKVYNAEGEGYFRFADLTTTNTNLKVLYAVVVDEIAADVYYGENVNRQKYNAYLDLLIERRDDGSLMNCHIPLEKAFTKALTSQSADFTVPTGLIELKINKLGSSEYYSLQDGRLVTKKEPTYNRTPGFTYVTIQELVEHMLDKQTIVGLEKLYTVMFSSSRPDISVAIEVEADVDGARSYVRLTEDYIKNEIRLDVLDMYFQPTDSAYNQTMPLSPDASYDTTAQVMHALINW